MKTFILIIFFNFVIIQVKIVAQPYLGFTANIGASKIDNLGRPEYNNFREAYSFGMSFEGLDKPLTLRTELGVIYRGNYNKTISEKKIFKYYVISLVPQLRLKTNSYIYIGLYGSALYSHFSKADYPIYSNDLGGILGVKQNLFFIRKNLIQADLRTTYSIKSISKEGYWLAQCAFTIGVNWILNKKKNPPQTR